MSASIPVESDIASLRDDFTVLKRDLAVLIEHLKVGTLNGTQAAASRLDESSRDAWRNVAARSERGFKIVSGQVEKQPLAALLLVIALGYAGGRLLSR